MSSPNERTPTFTGPTFEIAYDRAGTSPDERSAKPRLLDIVIPHQEASNWCWAAVVQGLVRYLDPPRQVRQCALARLARQVKNACVVPRPDTANEICSVGPTLSGIGYPSDECAGPVAATDVRDGIIRGLPRVAQISAASLYTHYVAITGFVDVGQGWLIVQDPSPIGGISQQMHNALDHWATTTTFEVLSC